MLLCKDFCDISCDLPYRDYNMIYRCIKDTIQAIRNGKTVIVKELSQMVSGEDQRYEDTDLTIPEDVATNEDATIGESSGENDQKMKKWENY